MKQAVFQGEEASAQNAAFLGDESTIDLVSYNSGMGMGSGMSMGSGMGADLGLGGGGGGCSHQIVAGVEYLQLRASHSQQTSYVERNTVNLGTNGEYIRFHQFDFAFTDSYRLYLGCRIPECGQEFRFTYSNFKSDGSFESVEQSGLPGQSLVDIASPFEVVPAGPGDRLYGTAQVELNNYDMSCSKTIPLGCALGCLDCGDCCDTCDPCGDSCGDPCGCDPCGCFCPAWDITWTGAVRIADLNSQLNYFNDIVSTTPPVGLPGRTAYSRVDFQGVGLRGGFLGRRYFGRSGLTSVYLKGDISLLVGDMDYSARGTSTDGSNQFTPIFQSNTLVVPVTELEAGGSIALTKNVVVSGGYLFSAWHDLGHRAEYNFAATTGNQVLSLDDANILAFDGWFLRAEAAF